MNLELFDLFGEEIFCSVCLEQVKEGQRTVVIKNCQHGFHQSCLDPWLLSNKSCPNCRGAVQDANINVSPTVSQLIELDRVYLTYVLFTWILGNLPGPRYKQNYITIHQFVSNFQWNTRRPFPFNLLVRNRASLSTIRTLRTYLIDRETTLFQQLYPTQVHRVIHKNPRVTEIRNQIQQDLQTFLQSLA